MPTDEEEKEDIDEKTAVAMQFFRSLPKESRRSHYGFVNRLMLTIIIMMSDLIKKTALLGILAILFIILVENFDDYYTEGTHPDLVIQPGSEGVLSVRMFDNPTLIYFESSVQINENISIQSIEYNNNLSISPCQNSTNEDCIADKYSTVIDYPGYVLYGIIDTSEEDFISMYNPTNQTAIITQGYQSKYLHDSPIAEFIYETTQKAIISILLIIFLPLVVDWLSKKLIQGLDKNITEKGCTSCKSSGKKSGGICRSCNGIGVLYSLSSK